MKEAINRDYWEDSLAHTISVYINPMLSGTMRTPSYRREHHRKHEHQKHQKACKEGGN